MALATAFDLRDGELLYSALARFRDAMRYPTARAVNRAAFGHQGVAVIDLPGHLDDFSRRTAVGGAAAISADEIVRNHTLLPYYALFTPGQRVAAAQQRMRGASARTLHGSLGIRASCVREVVALRFCTHCLRETRQAYGSGHWLTTHQLPGVLVCPRHGAILRLSPVRRSSSRSRLDYVSLEACRSAVPADGIGAEELGGCRQLATAIAEDSALLLFTLGREDQWRCLVMDRSDDPTPVGWRAMRTLLDRAGYVLPSGRIRLAALRRAVGATLTPKVCAVIGVPPIGDEASEDWLARLVRPLQEARHPLLYLSLVRALGYSATDLLAAVADIATPGHAGSVSSPVERSCRPASEDQPSTSHQRELSLAACVADARMSLRAIARTFGVDPKTVQRRALAIGAWRASWTAKVAMARTVDAAQRRSATRERHRQRWTALYRAHPRESRTRLRSRCPATFSYLYRFDRDWLTTHSPARILGAARPSRRVDWPARDALLLRHAREVVAALREVSPRPTRIRPATIAHRMGHATLIAQHGDKLPRTQAYLQRQSESREDFGRRRIAQAAQRLLATEGPVARWRLIRLAGLRPDLASALQPQLDAAITFLHARP